MKTRCKAGDLVLVVHDIGDCTDNTGRIVRVRGPLSFQRDYKKHCWLIEPVVQTPYAVEWRGEVSRYVVSFSHLVEHPDGWLMPIGRNPDDAKGTRAKAKAKRKTRQQPADITASLSGVEA